MVALTCALYLSLSLGRFAILVLLLVCHRGVVAIYFRLKVTDYNTQFSGITAKMLQGKPHEALEAHH